MNPTKVTATKTIIRTSNEPLIKPSDIYKSSAAFDKVNSLLAIMTVCEYVDTSMYEYATDRAWVNDLMIRLFIGEEMSKNDKIRCNKLWKIYKKLIRK